MKKFTLSFLVLSLSAASFAQSGGCYVNYSWTFGSGSTEIVFTDQSTFDTIIPPTLYIWDFGDGTTSSDPNPTHVYTSQDVYMVCLTVFNGNSGPCCSDTACHSVHWGKQTGIQEVSLLSNISAFYDPSDNTIRLLISLEKPQPLTFHLFDVTGKLLFQVPEKYFSAGSSEITVPLPKSSGLLLLRLQAGKEMVTKKILR